jgi:hypothetical protein
MRKKVPIFVTGLQEKSERKGDGSGDIRDVVTYVAL